MEYIYKFDTDNGFEETTMPKFYDAIEDDDFYLMYLGKADFIDFAKNISSIMPWLTCLSQIIAKNPMWQLRILTPLRFWSF